MDFVTVRNLGELKTLAGKEELVFALLYKNNSDASDCARKTLSETFTHKDKKICLAEINVEETRDIHGEYGIDSVPAVIFFRNGQLSNVTKGCMTGHYYEVLAEENTQVQGPSSSNQPKRPNVTVYSTPGCSWCTRLKDHLKRNRIQFREINVADDPVRAEEMRRKSGQMGVPQTDIDGQMIVGFDQSRIDRLLGIVGN